MHSADRKADLSFEALVASIASYLAAFNRADWDAIRDDFLDENVQAYLNGKLLLEGWDSFEAAYRLDFDRQKRVELVGEPRRVVPSNDDEVSIRVTILSQGPASASGSSMDGSVQSPPLKVEVIYTYGKASGKQVRHEIFTATTPSS
jgi:SnoaL-like domain